MKISDFFRNPAIAQTGQNEALREEKQTRSLEQDVQVARGEDRVSISPEARQFKRISELLAEDQSASSERVSAIKAQVQAGTYSVPSEDVARSLLRNVDDRIE